jgi:hypothetical protein
MTCYSLPSLIANRRREFEPYREHHSRSKGRDCEIESGAPVVGRYKYNREEISTKECPASVGNGESVRPLR